MAKENTCSSCAKFRATPGSKKNDPRKNLCCMYREVVDPKDDACEGYVKK